MSISSEMKSRVQAAYNNFKNTVESETHDAFLTKLEKLHKVAESHLAGENPDAGGSELFHALSALDKLPDGSSELPTAGLEARVKPDGELFGTGKWEILDPDWLEALEQLLLHFDNKAPFIQSPVVIDIPDEVSIAIVGDWGTGNWKTDAPSENVCAQLKKLKADYTIHLGDVYYAGTKEQETNNLVNLWPMGSKGGFTLNSNHEMYNGAYSYYAALQSKFIQQNNCSYFALTNKDWLIVGLDTAYHASALDLYLTGKLDQGQIDWLQSLPKKANTMVLSHHEGYDISGTKQGSVYSAVKEGLGVEPTVWYWGHLHNAISYHAIGDFNGRCVGHGAIPYGNSSVLKGNAKVAWYETELASDPQIPERVLNGLISLSIKGGTVAEQWIGEDGSTRFEHTISQ